MQHAKKLQVMQRALREEICTQCSQRPAGSEELDALTPRLCEPHCPIFLNLPKLYTTARHVRSDSAGPYEVDVRDHVCQSCRESTTAGDYCNENLTRSCPLSRYLGKIMTVIERVEEAAKKPKAKLKVK